MSILQNKQKKEGLEQIAAIFDETAINEKAPKMCPACLHPQSYFEIKESNY